MESVILLLVVASVCEGARGEDCACCIVLGDLSDFFKFGLDVGDSTAATNDDGSVGPLDLDTVFPFYGHTHSSVVVSTVCLQLLFFQKELVTWTSL